MKEINNQIYKVVIYCGGIHFIECENISELYTYVAKNESKGYVVTSVNEINKDGSTPRLAVKTNKEYKQILKEMTK